MIFIACWPPFRTNAHPKHAKQWPSKHILFYVLVTPKWKRYLWFYSSSWNSVQLLTILIIISTRLWLKSIIRWHLHDCICYSSFLSCSGNYTKRFDQQLNEILRRLYRLFIHSYYHHKTLFLNYEVYWFSWKWLNRNIIMDFNIFMSLLNTTRRRSNPI